MRPVKLVSNPPNPFESEYREFLEPPPSVKVQIYEDDTRSILSHNDSPNLPFRWAVNPYGACFLAVGTANRRRPPRTLGFVPGPASGSKLVSNGNPGAPCRQAS